MYNTKKSLSYARLDQYYFTCLLQVESKMQTKVKPICLQNNQIFQSTRWYNQEQLAYTPTMNLPQPKWWHFQKPASLPVPL